MTFNGVNLRDKVSWTETHVFFLGGPLSQWYMKAPFVAPVPMLGHDLPVADTVRGLQPAGTMPLDFDRNAFKFSCCEQYMMAGKAGLFGDDETLIEILKHSMPDDQKALGRKVKNFDLQVWNEHAIDIVFSGNLHSYQQNPHRVEYLRSFGDKIIVEGAHYDPVWGVKLAWNDPKIIDPANWQGTNWLGIAHMKCRDALNTEVNEAV